MILETPRLSLRCYEPEDFSALHAILSDPVTMQHYPKPYDEAGTRRWMDWIFGSYREDGFGLWAVIRREDGAFLGDCGITMQNIDGQAMPEIGYHIHRDFWRRGYGGEAACAVRDWGFTHTDFPVLYSYMTQGNAASRATAAHMGMRLIHSFHDAYYQDMVVYAITRDAWQTLKASGDAH